MSYANLSTHTHRYPPIPTDTYLYMQGSGRNILSHLPTDRQSLVTVTGHESPELKIYDK